MMYTWHPPGTQPGIEWGYWSTKAWDEKAARYEAGYLAHKERRAELEAQEQKPPETWRDRPGML
jgi:hypothetical protein